MEPPVKANSQSSSTSYSDDGVILRNERGKLTRHKGGIGNRGPEKKVDRDAAAISEIMKKSLFPEETDGSDSQSRSESRSHRIRRKKISKEEVHIEFPISQVVKLIKELDDKNPKFALFGSQLSGIMMNIPPKMVEEELIRFRRLEFLSALNYLKIEPKKFIENLVKSYLMTRPGNNYQIVTTLVETRSHISNEHQEWYDKVVFETLSPQGRSLYFRALSKPVVSSWRSGDVNLSSYEAMLIQDTNPSATFIENRRLLSEPSKCLEISTTMAQSGNSDLFIPYMQELFYILEARQAPLTEIRLATKQFLEVIKYPLMNDGKLIFERMCTLKNALKSLVIPEDQKSIEGFINVIIYEDGSSQIIHALIDDLLIRFSNGDLTVQDLAAEQCRMEGHRIVTAGRRDIPITTQFESKLIEYLTKDDIFHFAMLVFNLNKDTGRVWLKDFIKRLEKDNKLIPVFKVAVKFEYENIDEGADILRGTTCAATMFTLIMEPLCLELSRTIFDKMIKVLAPNEKTALKYAFNDTFVRNSKLTEFQNPQVVAANEVRFCNVIDELLDEIFTSELPTTAIKILNLVRGGLKKRSSLGYSRWETMSNLWFLRGVNANLTAMISSIHSTYKFQFDDPIHSVLNQFISVLVKLTTHDSYDALPKNNPRRQLHMKFHEKLLNHFKNELSKSLI